MLQTRLIRRNVPVKNLELGDVEPGAGASARRTITLKTGHLE